MSNSRLLFWLPAMLLIGGCQKTVQSADPETPATLVAPEQKGWRGVANQEDIVRIETLGEAWTEGLALARKGGFPKAMSEEGALLDPEAALPRPEPAPGSYMCRVVRLGSEKPRTPAFQAFKPFFCHVGVNPENKLSITKQTGSERPAGYLFPDGEAARMVFLGSLALGNEDAPAAYGDDPTRDMAGVFERVAPFRYRLVIPRPRGTAKLDVIELVPAPVQAES